MKTIPHKQWRREEAERLGLNLTTFEHRYYRGKIPIPKMVRVNKRVVLVVDAFRPAMRT